MDLAKNKAIFDSLSNTNSKLEKIEILKANKDNKDFLFLLDMLLNPDNIFGISTNKLNKKFTIEITHEGNIDVKNLFKYLLKHNTGTDLDINYVQNSLRAISRIYGAEYATFIEEIITKKLKIGCNIKLVNTAIPNFLPDFQVMLANKYFEKPEIVDGKNFTITTKFDGIRCILIKNEGKITVYSRQGQKIDGLVDIVNELSNFDCDNFVLDGEIMILDRKKFPSKIQYKKTIEIVTKDGEKHGVQLLAFDILSFKEFDNKKCTFSYAQRRYVLEKIFSKLNFVKVVPALYSGNDINKIGELLTRARKDGEEGIMINLNDAVYDFKRTNNLLKVKVMQDCDLEILGFQEGEGRFKDTLGAILVDYKGSILNVGSGFTSDERDYFWANRDKLVGRVIKVRYFEETQNKEGKKSLRFPVFDELREEGKEVSYK